MTDRVVIVGAGPAGVNAAEALVRVGLHPIVIDEGTRSGGQIYRRQPEGFKRSYETLYGKDAHRARGVHDRFDALQSQIDYRPETLVWNVAEGQVWAARAGETEAIPYDRLIVCSGAIDRLAPVPGWQLAGCYSLGGSQVALKAQACSIGGAVVFMGTGPLLYYVASQYVKAGANVVAVLDTSPLSGRVRALPKLATQPDLLWQGISLTFGLKRAGVTVLSGVTPVTISGDPETGVSGVTIRTASGTLRHFECDAVAMGWHLRPETQIADLARASFSFDPHTRQWLPEIDADGRASAPGLYLAGDGAKVLGARSAEVTGELAALAALADMGHAIDQDRRRHLLAERARYVRFAEGLAEAFPWPHRFVADTADSTVLCRCEGVTAADLRASVNVAHATETNRAKAFSRVGMGRCQGRYCSNASAEVISALRGEPLEKAGRLRGQAPVKPIPVATARTDA
ncbi:FAD/NAD(P)-dependent oxidoreductase [Rhizorhabdus sp. FW153]|uniref:FAD/NAD(P)-dependent oxidoreductase n=1 Tax=Rhizorhabdus sp. FW153 TaxID=3400216 RepID=UPI003CF3C401